VNPIIAPSVLSADLSRLPEQVEAALAAVGEQVGATFGDTENPLLVSVRSGARASMPGMMDTVLNLGLNYETVEALAKRAGDKRFAYDSYRRFIQMYSNVVLGAEHHLFEDILDNYKHLNGHNLDTDLTAEDWRAVIEQYKAAAQDELGEPVVDVGDAIRERHRHAGGLRRVCGPTQGGIAVKIA